MTFGIGEHVWEGGVDQEHVIIGADPPGEQPHSSFLENNNIEMEWASVMMVMNDNYG